MQEDSADTVADMSNKEDTDADSGDNTHTTNTAGQQT